MVYDVIIIGAGAAGLTAAIYTRRKLLKTLIISVDIGGQTLLTGHIENYPGYTELSGPKLMHTIHQQAMDFGAEFVMGKVVRVNKTKKGFKISLSNGEEYEGKTLILAFGKVPRSLGIPGEEKFIGRGVSTCAICDAPLFKNKIVAVVGGGNSALEAAELLSKFAKKVYLVHRRDQFRADEVTVEKVKKIKKIEFVLNSTPTEVKGEKFVTSIVIENVSTNEKNELKVDGIFVEIGYELNTDFVKHLVKLNEKKEIVVNRNCETSYPGIFAAGDVTDTPYKQTVIAAGDGAIAGLSTYNYIVKKEGKKPIVADWGKSLG